MDAITYTRARSNFTATMNRVCDDHAPIIITRQNQPPVVMISLEDYQSLEETLHLMKSPKNAMRLMKAINEYKQGKVMSKEIQE